MKQFIKRILPPNQSVLIQKPSARRSMILLVPIASAVLALSSVSCSDGESRPEPPPVQVTDTEPVGEGLKVIGYAMLGAAVVVVLGRMLK